MKKIELSINIYVTVPDETDEMFLEEVADNLRQGALEMVPELVNAESVDSSSSIALMPY